MHIDDKKDVLSTSAQTGSYAGMVGKAEGSYGRGWILLAVGIGSLMGALDGSVVNIVLPVVGRAFRSDVATIEWVVTIYLLVVSGLLLSFGRLGDLYGNKVIYVTGFGIFVASSMLCGLSSSALMLTIFRGLQAIGAAMIFANSPAILTKNFPAAQRGRTLGLQSMMTYLGLTLGPSLGGWLTSIFSWRAVFYINVPIGLTALLLSMRFIPHDAPSTRTQPFDIVGAGTFMTGLTLLLLGLNQGDAWGWGSPLVLGLLMAAVVLLVLFVTVESRVEHPMLDLSLFRARQFSAATISAVCNYICLNIVTFMLPFYLINGRHLDTAQAGLILTAQPIMMAIAAPISGALSDRVGPRLLGTLGMAIMGLGMFGLSQMVSAAPIELVALGIAVIGLGTGIFISPNSSALMGSAPRARQGIAAGIMATARNVGMVLGVGLAGAVLASSTAAGLLSSTGEAGTGIYTAMRVALMVATVIAGVGAITSAVRGETQHPTIQGS
jgi:EmrB/QacA subfamily drug resistance transporter